MVALIVFHVRHKGWIYFLVFTVGKNIIFISQRRFIRSFWLRNRAKTYNYPIMWTQTILLVVFDFDFMQQIDVVNWKGIKFKSHLRNELLIDVAVFSRPDHFSKALLRDSHDVGILELRKIGIDNEIFYTVLLFPKIHWFQ